MAKVTYVSDTAPHLELRIQDSPEIIAKFHDKLCHFDDETEEGQAAIKVFDNLINTRANISQLVKKIDMAAAVRVAEAHMREMAQIGGIVKGGVDSSAIARAKFKQTEDHLRVTMQAEGATPEQIANAIKDLEAGSGFVLPVTGEAPASTPNDGVVIDEAETARMHVASVASTPTHGPKPTLAGAQNNAKKIALQAPALKPKA